LYISYHWDLTNGRRLTSFDGHDGDVVGLSFSPEGNTFITCSLDKTIKLWDMREGGAKACKRTFRGHTGDINGAVVSHHNSRDS
jgi:WD40 repeat protein